MFEKTYLPVDEVAQRWGVSVSDLLQHAAIGELRLVAIFRGGACVTHGYIEETEEPRERFYIPDRDEWLCGPVIIPLSSAVATGLWHHPETHISGWTDEETGAYIEINYYAGATRGREDPKQYTFTLADVFLSKSEIDRVEKSEQTGAEANSTPWDGIDFDHECWPEELSIALTTWRAVTNSPDPSKTPKEQITVWLNHHHPNLSEDAKTRIATVCNWNKAGGRPKSRQNGSPVLSQDGR